jgi:transposase, IS5 family
VLAAKALPGRPYDGHTLATVIPHVEGIIGNEIQRIIADKGYRGHGAPAPPTCGSTPPSKGAT